ncbi:CsbD family protein [Streptococcus hongkongensis]|nr:general stress protein CsbD [Streptococcus uberis]
MLDEKTKAKFEEIKGEAKETAGKVLGDKKLEVEGILEKGISKGKESLSDLKNIFK